MSTGMSTFMEIKESVSMFEDRTIGLMHATSSYPCPPEELNLNMIKTLSNEFQIISLDIPGMNRTSQQPLAAVAFGAKIVERHITLDRASGEQINQHL